jgi:hypothetical protein
MRRTAVAVLAQGALIAPRASVAWNPNAQTRSADPARQHALDDGHMTLNGRSYAVRAQVVTALKHFVDCDPDAPEDFINACNDTTEDLMTLECASNVELLSLKDEKAEPGPFGPSSVPFAQGHRARDQRNATF